MIGASIIFRWVLVASIIVAAAEISKRSTTVAAVLISLPLTSVIALSLRYWDTRDVAAVSTLSTEILWMVIPSLFFFVVLPALLSRGIGYWTSLCVACALTAVAYAGGIQLLAKFRTPT